MNEDLFSVIVWLNNRPNFWREAISSVLAQSYPAIELIIASDTNEKIAEEDISRYIEDNKRDNLKSCHLQMNKIGKGKCQSCNIAIEQCTGRYVQILDSGDALYDENVLASFKNAFDILPGNEFIVTTGLGMNEDGVSKCTKQFITVQEGEKYNSLTAKEQQQQMYGGFVLSIHASAFKKEIFTICGVLDDVNYSLPQDIYYFLHITGLGYRANYCSFKAIKHRACDANQLLQNDITDTEAMLRQDLITVAERELFPKMDSFTQKNILRIFDAYYNNIRTVKIAQKPYHAMTNDNIEGVCPKAFALFHEEEFGTEDKGTSESDAKQSKIKSLILAMYHKATIYDNKIVYPNQIKSCVLFWLIMIVLTIVHGTISAPMFMGSEILILVLNIAAPLLTAWCAFKFVFDKLLVTAFELKTIANRRR